MWRKHTDNVATDKKTDRPDKKSAPQSPHCLQKVTRGNIIPQKKKGGTKTRHRPGTKHEKT